MSVSYFCLRMRHPFFKIMDTPLLGRNKLKYQVTTIIYGLGTNYCWVFVTF